MQHERSPRSRVPGTAFSTSVRRLSFALPGSVHHSTQQRLPPLPPQLPPEPLERQQWTNRPVAACQAYAHRFTGAHLPL